MNSSPATPDLDRVLSRVVVLDVAGLRTVSEKNASAPWGNPRAMMAARHAAASRKKKQRAVVRLVLDAWSLRPPAPPLHVTLVRCSSHPLDTDNLARALSAVRDEVAAWLLVDDRKHVLVSYWYGEEKAPKGCYGVRIILEPRTADTPSTSSRYALVGRIPATKTTLAAGATP